MMSYTLSSEDATSLFRSALTNGNHIRVTVTGTSMHPTFRDRQTIVDIGPVDLPIKKHDILLFERNNVIVLHRVISVNPLITRGDALTKIEYVNDIDVIGTVYTYERNNKQRSPHSIYDLWQYTKARLYVVLKRIYHKVVKR